MDKEARLQKKEQKQQMKLEAKEKKLKQRELMQKEAGSVTFFRIFVTIFIVLPIILSSMSYFFAWNFYNAENYFNELNTENIVEDLVETTIEANPEIQGIFGTIGGVKKVSQLIKTPEMIFFIGKEYFDAFFFGDRTYDEGEFEEIIRENTSEYFNDKNVSEEIQEQFISGMMSGLSGYIDSASKVVGGFMAGIFKTLRNKAILTGSLLLLPIIVPPLILLPFHKLKWRILREFGIAGTVANGISLVTAVILFFSYGVINLGNQVLNLVIGRTLNLFVLKFFINGAIFFTILLLLSIACIVVATTFLKKAHKKAKENAEIGQNPWMIV